MAAPSALGPALKGGAMPHDDGHQVRGRRDFLKAAGGLGLGLAIGPGAQAADEPGTIPTRPFGKTGVTMKYDLGRTQHGMKSMGEMPL